MYVGPWQEYQLMKVIGDLHDQRARNCEHTGELVCPSNTCNSSHRHSPLDPTAQSNLLNPSNDKEEDCAISYARGGAAVAHGLVYSAYNNNRRNDNNGDDSIDGASTSGDRNPNAYRSPPSTTSWRIAGLSPRQTLQAAVRLRAMQPRCSVRVNAEALGERASQCACRRVLLGHPKNADGVGSGSSRRADASVSLAEAAGAQRKRREQMCALYCVGGDGVAPVGEDAGGRGAESVWTLGNIEDSTCGRANRSDSVNEPDCSGGGNMLGSHALISGGVGCGMHNSAHSSQPRLSLNDAHYPDRSEIQMEALLGATARAMATTATSPATYSSVLSSSLYSRAEGKEEGVPWDDMIPTTRRVASIAHASGVQSLDQASENNPRRTTKTDETDSLVVVVNALGEGDGGAAVGGGAYAADVAMDDISALLTWAEDLNIDAIDAIVDGLSRACLMNYWEWSQKGTRLVYDDEVFILEQKGVALYDNDKKTAWGKGKLSLTTHHIMFRAKGDDATVLLLPLETIARSNQSPSTVKGVGFSSDKIVLSLPGNNHCKLSFREGHMRVFYEALVSALHRQMWRVHRRAGDGAHAHSSPAKSPALPAVRPVVQTEAVPIVKHSAAAPSEDALNQPGQANQQQTRHEQQHQHEQEQSHSPATRHILLQPGIAGIVQASSDSVRLKDRLSDIDDVMLKASSLVESIRALKQRAVSHAAEGISGSHHAGGSALGDSDADVLAIESIEATLGLGTLVQRRELRVEGGDGKKMYDSARRFHEELADELHAWMVHARNAAHFGKAPLIPLMELFSLYNRARSGDLVSPEDVLSACRTMSQRAESQYTMRTLASGRKALLHKNVSVTLGLLVRRLGPRVVAVSAVGSDPILRTNGETESNDEKNEQVKQSSALVSSPVTVRTHSGVENSSNDRNRMSSGDTRDGSTGVHNGSARRGSSSTEHAASAVTTELPKQLSSINEVQMAGLLSCAVAVARDVLADLEQRGYLCHSDEGFGCCLYYWNIFLL